MKWNIIFIFTSGVAKWTRCYGSLWFGIQEQEPWIKTRGEAVISRCKHRLHSGSVICAFIDGILSRVLVDSERRSAAFITELNTILGVIHAPVKGWPSASHLNSLHLWASLLSTKFLSDCLFFFWLYSAWYGRTVSGEANKRIRDLIHLSTARSSDSEALMGVCLL